MNFIQFLIYCIIGIITTTATCIIIVKLKNLKIKYDFKIIILIIVFSALIILNNLYSVYILKIGISFLLFLILLKIITKEKITQIIPYLLIYTIVSLLLEIIISLTLFINIKNVEELNKLTIFKCGITLMHTLIIYMFFSLKFIKKLVNKIIELIKNFITLYRFFIASIIIMMIIMVYRATSFADKYFILYEVLCVIYILSCLKIIIKDKYNNYILTNKNRIISETNKAYSKTIEECREFKHNLKNDLLRIKSSLPEKEQKAINDIITKYNKKYEWINKIDEIPDGLQGMIYLKIMEAKNKKVKIYVNTKSTIKINEKDYTDLCDVLGITIDNAIEGTLETKNKVIEINIEENENTIIFKIINTFSNLIDTTKIGSKNYSTKNRNSGIGLYYIYKMKNKNIKVESKIVKDLFITNIIYKKNSN